MASRKFVAVLLAFALSSCVSATSTPKAATVSDSRHERPNILIIVADDLGFGDVSFTGGSNPTPNIDRIAEAGMMLDRFYVASVCSPTRAGLLTGRYPHRFGIMGQTISPGSDFGMPSEEVTLAEVLAEAGYGHRAFIGKWHLGNRRREHHPLTQGFTSFYGMLNGEADYFSHKRWGETDWHRDFAPSRDEGYATDLLSAEAVRQIEQSATSADPWFVWLAYNAPHTPFQAKQSDLDAIGFDPTKGRHRRHGGGEGGAYPDPDYALEGRGNIQRQTVRAMIRSMDTGIGLVIDTLERTGQLRNTIILFTSDNGGAGPVAYDNGPLRSWKTTHFEGGVRVAAAFAWPERLSPRDKAAIGPVSYVDLMPTLAAIAGASLPDRNLDGVDVSSNLLSADPVADRVLLLGEDYRDLAKRRKQQGDRLTGRAPAVLEGRWKLVGDMLFDVEEDPGETEDLSRQYPDIVSRLKANRKALVDLRAIPHSAIRGGRARPPRSDWTPAE